MAESIAHCAISEINGLRDMLLDGLGAQKETLFLGLWQNVASLCDTFVPNRHHIQCGSEA